ncbi:MAG: hypothetical protein ABI808_13450 [Pseudonocardiales bacterium]
MKRILWAAIAATLVVSVGACSSSKKSTKKTTKKTTAAATSPATTATATGASPSETSSSGAVPTEAQLQAALLTAADLTGFTDGKYTKTDKSGPCAPAGSPSFRQQTSPLDDAGAKLDSATPQAALTEVVFVYADSATAQKAFSTGKAAVDCTTGTVYYSDGTKASVTISPPSDVTSSVAADTAVGWQLKNADVQGTQILSLVGQAIIALSFSTGAGTDVSGLPDVLLVAKTAVGKLKTASGGH